MRLFCCDDKTSVDENNCPLLTENKIQLQSNHRDCCIVKKIENLITKQNIVKLSLLKLTTIQRYDNICVLLNCFYHYFMHFTITSYTYNFQNLRHNIPSTTILTATMRQLLHSSSPQLVPQLLLLLSLSIRFISRSLLMLLPLSSPLPTSSCVARSSASFTDTS